MILRAMLVLSIFSPPFIISAIIPVIVDLFLLNESEASETGQTSQDLAFAASLAVGLARALGKHCTVFVCSLPPR